MFSENLKITFIVIVLSIQWGSLCVAKDLEVRKGPNPEPIPTSLGSDSKNLRSRFPINFRKNQKSSAPPSSTDSGKTGGGGVKILEALSSRAQKVLKSNPSFQSSDNSKSVKSELESPVGPELRSDYDEGLDGTEESDEVLLSPFGDNVFSKRNGSNPNISPVFQNTPGPEYNMSPAYNTGNGNRPRPPTIIRYKAGTSTASPMIFPPESVGPAPTFETVGPAPTFETVGPAPTSEPVGPPSPTSTPIIGGGDIFPPSPPEIESVGRSLSLRSSSPRTRIASVLPTTNSREVESGALGASGSRRSGVPGTTGLRSNSGASRTSSRIRTRLRDKVKDSLESVNEGENGNDFSNQLDPDVITDFVFSDIKCFKTRTKEYFGSTIHMKSGFHPPYVRDRPQDTLTSNECRMEIKPGTKNTFHMTVTDLKGCGVEQCGDYMCLTMVFPRVPTLALADDEVTTIKCLPQKSSMSDTRTISFAGDTLDNRRSSSTVEGGGQDFAAEVGVFRQNPGSANGLFVKRVNSGGVVQLGEPLQLRSIVRGGDGWKHSRLSEVKVWRMRDAVPAANLDNLDPNEASEVITLVDGLGCRNDEYNVIAESHPLKDPRNELINHFTFKAFLFRGQRANEPLILTAKVHACQEDLDCIPRDCDISSSRTKRSPLEVHNSSAIIHDWNSRMALRVVGMKDHSASLTEEDFPIEYSSAGGGRSIPDNPMTCAEKMAATGLGGGFIVLLLCGITLALYAYVIKGNALRREKSVPFSIALAENGGPQRRQPTIQRSPQQGQLFHPNTENNTINKPLPLPPTSYISPGSNKTNKNEKMSKSEMTNVTKMLQKIADKNTQQEQTEYECIDETSSSGDNSSSASSSKKSDNGVYIVYCCKDEKSKGKRPKSAPASLREKRRMGSKKGSSKNRKKVSTEIYSHPEATSDSLESQTEITEDSDDSSDANNNNHCRGSGFAGRRTVRSVKGRSNRYNHQNDDIRRSMNERKQNKVVTGIRRRLSSFYKDAKIQQFKSNIIGNNGTKSGSFPAKQKSRASTKEQRRTGHISDGVHSSTQLSSDLDSAYYGSEFNDDVLMEMRHLATQHQQQNLYPNGGYMRNGGQQQQQLGQYQEQPQLSSRQELLATSIKMQLRNSTTGKVSGPIRGPVSPPLEPGQTKSAHFVTRNDNSTKILIVPETHV